jgi:hypothetical protein
MRQLLSEFRRNPDALAGFAAGLARELMALRTRLELRNIRSARERVENYLALNTRDYCTHKGHNHLKDGERMILIICVVDHPE